MTTSALNFRIEEGLKRDAYNVLKELHITPTEAIRLYFEYIAENKKLPIKKIIVSDENMALIAIAKKRLNNPKSSIKVDINEL